MDKTDTRRSIEAIWRIESARLIAGLTRIVRDIGLAEDLAHDALVAALQQWPSSGTPPNPAAWLMTTAKNRGIDRLRRDKRVVRKHEELRYSLTNRDFTMPDLDSIIDDDFRDDLLRLIFTACHPVLKPEARVALTLRVLGGLTTEEIARTFLVSEATMAQRILRAKRTLAEKQVPFEVPGRADLEARLSSVLEVIYAIFNEGYAATSGPDLLRANLAEEALRLGRMLAELAKNEPEVHGLVGLMELQASRFRARVSPSGVPVLLLQQDRSKWDQMLIRRGLQAIQRAEQLGCAAGPYLLQASIAACHARARRPEDTDWLRISQLYESLLRVAPSPVVELNRAVAVGMASGPAAGLTLLNKLTEEPLLADYMYLPSVRADFLKKLGRYEEARTEFERAAELAGNQRQQQALLAEATVCARLLQSVS